MARAVIAFLVVLIAVGGAFIALNYTPLGQLVNIRTPVTTRADTTTPTETVTTVVGPSPTPRATTTTPTVTQTGPATTQTTTQTPRVEPIVPAELLNPNLLTVSAYWDPGGIYVYDSQQRRLERRIAYRVSCFAFDPNDTRRVYYTDANRMELFLLNTATGERTVVFRHSTYVRCVRFGPGGFVYFSEASGAGADGKIFRFRDGNAELFYVVRLQDVGFWAGDFDFDHRGNLYLSSGNSIPSSLYIVENQVPRVITTLDSSTVGLRYVTQISLRVEGGTLSIARGLLFTDYLSSVYLHDLDTRRTYRIYQNSSFTIDNRLTDVALAS
ncbi:MAG: hypothetical protein NZ957_03585 [Thaumarchaeota archaeon]|nr:hypothetical protein [Candidatus Calditenuaceae archaeon]